MRTNLRHLVLLAASAACAVGVVASADSRVRHMYVDGLSDGDVAAIVLPSSGEPVGIVSAGEVLPPPTGGAQRDDEALLTAPPEGSGGAAPSEVRPDRMTSTVTSTDYFESFTPAVAPYKRVASYDGVRLDADGTPVLIVSNAASEAVVILGANPPSAGPRDAFWGTVMLDFRRGPRVGIPSVAPDARILYARSEPPMDFVVESDSAGNFFVRTLEPAPGAPGAPGVVRFTFLTDAPRGYFGRTPPAHRVDALAQSVPAVPASVRERGLRFAAELGVVPGMSVGRALDILVEHFRSFVEADTIPSASGDTYLDLARGKVGVCRHRAYAFVVTALALGIPANYVQNEAHAWVEVRLRDGYLRIDLGGSARGVNAHGLQDRPRHEVSAPDPFPEPEVFVRDYLERGVAPEPETRASGHDGANEGGSSSEGASSPRTSSGQTANQPSSSPSSPSSPSSMTGDDSPEALRPPNAAAATDGPTGAPTEDADVRIATALVLDSEAMRVYRGQMLNLAGRVVGASGEPVSGGRIEIRVEGTRLLGVALSDENGRFSVALGIPPDLGVGRHPMNISFVGNREFRPARAL